MHSWPLYLYTLAIQSAVGGCIMLIVYNTLLKKVLTGDVLQKNNLKSLVILAATSIVGLFFSFFHLGYPLNAINAITNLGTSWMSREILFTVLFIALLFSTLVVSRKKQCLSQTLLICSGIVGLPLIFAMGSLYSNTIFEPWNSVNTIIGFYCSTIILGAVIVNTIFLPIFRTKAASLDAVKMPTLLIILAAFVIQFAFVAAFGSNILTLNTSVSLIRWLCSLSAAVLLGYLYYQKNNKKAELIYVPFAFMLIGELVGKYLFYLPLS